ncbi:MAG: CehA/McbA family metallohydrolase [Acidobacteriota bacterium]
MKKAIALTLIILGAAVAAPAAALSIKAIKDAGEAPAAISGAARPGDILVSDGKFVAAIAVSPRVAFSKINCGYPAVSGFLLAFLPEGASKRAEVQIGAPSVRIDGKAVSFGAATARPEGQSVVVRSSFEKNGVKLEVRTRYAFAFGAGRIDIVSEIRNAGPSEITGLSFGLGANAQQNLSFSPYSAQAFPRLNFMVWQRPDHALGWYNPNPVEKVKQFLPGRLMPGQVHRVSYSLVAGRDPVEVLKKLYALAQVRPETAAFEFPGFEGLAEIIVKEPVSGAVFYRAFMARPAPLAAPLPKGTYSVRANLFPAVVEKTIAVGGDPKARPTSLEAPKPALVEVAVADKRGRPGIGKVSFIGLAPTPSPCFAPDDPVASGRNWEAAKNSIFVLRKPVPVVLPAGTYLVTASRGPEYARETRVVEIFKGDNPALNFVLEKAVDTAGLVSIDPHMHTQNSDGSVSVAERLRGVAGEGLDVAVAADHNFVSDYGPDLARLGLAGDLAVILGTEVTAKTGSIHYNVYPVTRRPGQPGGGVIDIKDETPATLFVLSRAKDPAALVQANHPRLGSLGYFVTYDLDPAAAAAAKAPFSLEFDVMEIMNGGRIDDANRGSIEDFFHLLDRGYPIRAVGSSDAHGIDGGETGYARTYVLYDGQKGASLDQAALVRGLKEGRSFVSNGPIISVRANGHGRLGDRLRARGGRVALDIEVQAAPWIDVAEVRLVVNGARRDPLPLEGGDGRAVRFRDRVKVKLDRDAWIAVEVRGRGSLFPVVQQRSGDGSAAEAAYPYALTNPILFDVDGDGRVDPVRPEKVIVK